MLIAIDNGFTGFEQGIRSMLSFCKTHYEKNYFNSIGGRAPPSLPYGSATAMHLIRDCCVVSEGLFRWVQEGHDCGSTK